MFYLQDFIDQENRGGHTEIPRVWSSYLKILSIILTLPAKVYSPLVLLTNSFFVKKPPVLSWVILFMFTSVSLLMSATLKLKNVSSSFANKLM